MMTPEQLPHHSANGSNRRTHLVMSGLLTAAFLLFALPALWPFTQVGLTLSADGMLHVLRTALLSIHQHEGIFYPRWMPDLVLGYGYPLLSFYGPATYYLASLFVLFGADPALALLLTFVTLLLLAGAGAYLLVYDLADGAEGWRRRAAAMVGAVAYVYAPYLLINVYARGAVAEVGAQMLLPWVLWFLRRIFHAANPTPAALGFALSTALLAVTHNISLIFMPPMIVLYGLAVIWQARTQPWSLERRVGVAVLAGAAALGVSAFFWAPLLLERANLAATAFEIAARYVGENAWTWSNFIDFSFPFEYSTAIPFQLGVVQVLLAAVGFAMLPRRTAEWWALLAIALAGSLMISAWALPLWLNSDVLLIAQFPWRLLALVSLPLAIFPAGIVLRVRPQWAALAIALALIAVIIASQRPTATAFTPLLNQPVAIGRPAAAQFEFQTNAYGTSSSSEFLPRWAGTNLFGDAEADGALAPRPDIRLEMATPVEMEAVITTTAPIDLKVTNFYFPGWTAILDGQPAELRPDPARGMQTITVPGGVHRIVISGIGTPLQQAATWISLVTLAALAIGVWLAGARRRWLAALPALCLLTGLFATLQAAPRPVWQASDAPLGDGNVALLGFRYQLEESRMLHLFPTWFVHASTAGSLHWQIVDADGRVVTESSGDAFFNTLRLASIPATTIFDDAHQLALPPALPAGDYSLRAGVSAPGETPAYVTVGSLRLPDVPAADATAMNPLDLRFGEAVLLDGWNVRVDGRAAPDPAAMLVLRPGQVLEYTLFWRADGAVDENYHGFVHLLDHTQQAVRQHDKTAGSLLAPSRLWNTIVAQPDTYRLVIDGAVPGGLYQPTVGLYRFSGDGQRLPITGANGQPLCTEFALPAIKVLAEPKVTPSQQVNVRLGDWGELQGVSIAPDTTIVTPGDVITLTLVYKAKAAAPVDYTRFIHMHSPALGMAAQQDAPPLNGGNPTTTWGAGEQIVETATLQIAPDAQPGEYMLWFGLYDPANGERAPLYDRTGQPLPDNQLPLIRLSVE